MKRHWLLLWSAVPAAGVGVIIFGGDTVLSRVVAGVAAGAAFVVFLLAVGLVVRLLSVVGLLRKDRRASSGVQPRT